MAMIRVITNDVEHDHALHEIDRLWDGKTPDDVATLEALVLLTSNYEEKRWPSTIELDPIDMIKHAMSPDVGHPKHEFIEMIGSPAGASQILARKRPLTLEMIRKVSERWGIAIELLTPSYRLEAEPVPVAPRKTWGERSRPRSSVSQMKPAFVMAKAAPARAAKSKATKSKAATAKAAKAVPKVAARKAAASPKPAALKPRAAAPRA